jgi:hypothetical protein
VHEKIENQVQSFAGNTIHRKGGGTMQSRLLRNASSRLIMFFLLVGGFHTGVWASPGIRSLQGIINEANTETLMITAPGKAAFELRITPETKIFQQVEATTIELIPGVVTRLRGKTQISKISPKEIAILSDHNKWKHNPNVTSESVFGDKPRSRTLVAKIVSLNPLKAVNRKGQLFEIELGTTRILKLVRGERTALLAGSKVKVSYQIKDKLSILREIIILGVETTHVN